LWQLLCSRCSAACCVFGGTGSPARGTNCDACN
jgi:hypothetical protein